jgi:hypothetical protein
LTLLITPRLNNVVALHTLTRQHPSC